MNPATILIVEDDAAERGFLKTTLADLGYRVCEASDGLEGLEEVVRNLPDLILLDLEMPRLDGYATCRLLRSDPRTRLVPIVIVTVLDALPNKLRALECGADDYLNKPVIVAELAARVRSLLSLRRYTLELEDAGTVLETVARFIERRDPYTAFHGTRVGEEAVRLGRASGLSEGDLRTLRLGATFHDIGKVAIPDAILQKSSKLTDEEYAIIKTHPAIGADLCRSMRTLQPAVPLIRHHHERLDGSGYPDRLRGDEIPLPVRILTVADIYDALTTPRAYRQAFSRDKTFAILHEEAERGWWDRHVVEACGDLHPARETAVPAQSSGSNLS